MFTRQAQRKLIVPLFLDQLFIIAVGMIATVMLSYAGEAAVSAVSLVDIINNLFVSVLIALATGGSIVVSQYIGRGEKENARAASGQLVAVNAAISAVIMLLVALLHRPMLRLFFGGVESDIMASAVTYFVISGLSYPFLAVYHSCAALFRAAGNSRVPMAASIAMNLFNVAGSAVGIFFLQAGVTGVAVATLVARALAAAVMLRLSTSRGRETTIKLSEVFSWNGDMVRRILRVSIPTGVENGIFQLGRVLVSSTIALFGTTSIVATGIAYNLMGIAISFPTAINLAMMTVVGQSVGAGEHDQAAGYTKRFMKLAYIGTLCAVAAVTLLQTPVLGLYAVSEEAKELAGLLTLIQNIATVLLWPMSFTLSYALRAAGDVRFTMVISIASMFSLRVSFAYILGVSFGLGAVGVWIAMSLDWLLRFVVYAVRFKRGKWRNFRVI